VASWGGESSLRFSLWSGHPSIDENGQLQFVDQILSLPIDYFDGSAGFYNIDKRLIYPSLPDFVYSRRIATLELAKHHLKTQFIMSGKSSGAWDTPLSK
jgi:NADPH2 dehydrogenase